MTEAEKMIIEKIIAIINRNIAINQDELNNLSDIPSNDFQVGLCKGSIGTYKLIKYMLEMGVISNDSK